MKFPVVLAVIIGVGVLACSSAAPAPVVPTPNIEATVEARLAQERAIESTVEARPTEKQASQPISTAVPTYTSEPARTPPMPARTSPTALGKNHHGRILTLAISEMRTTDELRWSTRGSGDTIRNLLIQPDKEGNELVLMWIEVANHIADNVVFKADEQAVVLTDYFGNDYRPINLSDSIVSADKYPPEAPGSAKGKGENQMLFLDGSFLLPKGHMIDGWMIFELPKDTKLKHLRWQAGDSITIGF